MKYFSRKSAISMDIVDPESPNATEPITDLISLGDIFLIIKAHGIYQGHFPEDIDPEGQDLSTKPTYTKLYSIGSTNPYVARAFIQIKTLVDFSQKKVELLSLLWETVQYLFRCENDVFYIYNETLKHLPVCDKIIEQNKHKNFIPKLPTVPFLETHVAQFLINTKHFLVNSFKIISIICSSANYESNFEKYKEYLQKNPQYKDLLQLITEDLKWIKILTNMRNAVEHPRQGQRIEIKNIALYPGNKVSPPAWRYDLTAKKCGKQEFLSDLLSDLDKYLYNLLTFHEDLWALCINHDLQKSFPFLCIAKEVHKGDTRGMPTIFYVRRKDSNQ